MAGYSGTPLPKKLGIKEDSRIALISAPEAFGETLGAMPGNPAVVAAESGAIDVMVCFLREATEVETCFLELKPRLAYTGGLWMAWLKNKPGRPAALTENLIRDVGLAAGLVDNKVCAIDDDWSGLRFVWRLEDRPKTAKGEKR